MLLGQKIAGVSLYVIRALDDIYIDYIDAASSFQTNHVRAFFRVWRHDFFGLRDSQHVYLQEEALPWFLSAIEL